MDVRNRPGWIKNAESKVYEPKRLRSHHTAVPASTVDDDEESNNDQDALHFSAAAVDVAPEVHDDPGGELEQLKRRQQAQMQALLVQQTLLGQQQEQLLAQQEAQLRDQMAKSSIQKAQLEQQQASQYERQLELERLTQQQQQQLTETEMLVEQQRHYLVSKHNDPAFGDACDPVLCGGSGQSNSKAPPAGAPISGCFSAEI